MGLANGQRVADISNNCYNTLKIWAAGGNHELTEEMAEALGITESELFFQINTILSNIKYDSEANIWYDPSGDDTYLGLSGNYSDLIDLLQGMADEGLCDCTLDSFEFISSTQNTHGF